MQTFNYGVDNLIDVLFIFSKVESTNDRLEFFWLFSFGSVAYGHFEDPEEKTSHPSYHDNFVSLLTTHFSRAENTMIQKPVKETNNQTKAMKKIRFKESFLCSDLKCI